MLDVYVYDKCSTCRAAVEWLRSHHITFREVPIKEQPPSPPELARMVEAKGGEMRKLCNTSGLEYRRLKLAERLPGMKPAELFRLLGENGMLVKRPFVLGNGVALVGFDEKAWAVAFKEAGR
ncbi:MAG TPA: Spx/MgsR family RNA polymerase-binding regulatory protein [Opitutaceae bacterium]|jgi:arsenate reductase